MASSDADLRERLAKLEKMMAAMMSNAGSGEAKQAPRQRPTISPLGTSSTSKSFEENISSSFVAATENEIGAVGQILFQEGCSAYYDADFWPGLIPEVGYECLLLLIAPSIPEIMKYTLAIRLHFFSFSLVILYTFYSGIENTRERTTLDVLCSNGLPFKSK